jgi:hypothetical protein
VESDSFVEPVAQIEDLALHPKPPAFARRTDIPL